MTSELSSTEGGAKEKSTSPAQPTYRPIHVGNVDGERVLTVVNLTQLARDLQNGDAATVAMPGTPARGIPLFSNGHLGADMIYLAPGDSFPLHVHDGHHFLFCIKGEGTVTFDNKDVQIRPGDLYMIEASIPHAVGATPGGAGHWLVAFGAPHAKIDSTARMRLIGDEDAERSAR